MNIQAQENSSFESIADFEQGYEGLSLFGNETVKEDTHEDLYGFDGSNVHYTTSRYKNIYFDVTGFRIVSRGAVITAMLKEPVNLFEEQVNAYGDRTDYTLNDGEVEKAILECLGAIGWVKDNI